MVQLIYRKKDDRSFSIEKVFSIIKPLMEKKMAVQEQFAATRSASPLSIVKNLLHLRKIKGGLYHITGDIHYGVFAFPRSRTILTIHDCVFLKTSKGWRHWIFKKLWLQWPVKYAAVVTTISEKSKQEIIDHTGCDPEKIVVINNPVAPEIRYTEKIFNSADPVILFIGTKPNKNLFRAIESLKGISCKLEIIGKLSEEQKTALQAAGIDYAAYQNLSNAAIAEQYAACDMVLFPSTYEGFGLPLIEAQQAGRPVVVSDISPMKEVANGTACLVDPYDPSAIRQGVLRVIEDADYRNSLVQQGFSNAEQYHPEKIAALYVQLYESFLPGNLATVNV